MRGSHQRKVSRVRDEKVPFAVSRISQARLDVLGGQIGKSLRISSWVMPEARYSKTS